MDVKKLVSQMTLEEKASLCSGLDFWRTKPIERLGIPSFMVSDGPHGLRKQNYDADHFSINESIKAVCYPAGCATAASFDRDLLTLLGEAIGDSCQHESLSVILGPAVNIKRSPLCGRNFEYFSEDPYLAGEMASAYTHGVQSKNVGVSIKHFAANNQEHRRMSSDSVADERTLREIYFPPFEETVRREKPWTVMASYNRINGTYSVENSWLLEDVLRGEWGFDGYVVTDWGAVADRVKGLEAGVDLEMPGSNGVYDAKIVKAVREGSLDEKVVDLACERILTIKYRFLENAKPETPWDKEAQHELSARISEQCMVLLKNDGVLPLDKNDKIAFIGEFAEKPRFQGGGSSHINCFKTTCAVDAADGIDIIYAKGFDIETDSTTSALTAEAVAAAKSAKVAVVFAGLPDVYESEGYDRVHMRLPDCQNELISAVAEANPNIVVVLHNGSPVEMPWADSVKGILEAYLGGQAVGLAAVRVLFGEANPCGRLPETFPVKLEDNPSYLFYGGEGDTAEYRECIFVGYRYYDKKKMNVLFPFGHGLSYTTFEYSNLRTDKKKMKDTETLTVSVDVKNTGSMSGREVVQLYVGDVESTPIRPLRELKGFEKVSLKPGETKTAVFKLEKRAFAYWNKDIRDWHVETGEFVIEIGKSSRDIVLKDTVFIESGVELPVHYDEDTIILDVMANDKARPLMKHMMESLITIFSPVDGDSGASIEAISEEMAESMVKYMPLRAAVTFANTRFTEEMLKSLIDELNRL